MPNCTFSIVISQYTRVNINLDVHVLSWEWNLTHLYEIWVLACSGVTLVKVWMVHVPRPSTVSSPNKLDYSPSLQRTFYLTVFVLSILHHMHLCWFDAESSPCWKDVHHACFCVILIGVLWLRVPVVEHLLKPLLCEGTFPSMIVTSSLVYITIIDNT